MLVPLGTLGSTLSVPVSLHPLLVPHVQSLVPLTLCVGTRQLQWTHSAKEIVLCKNWKKYNLAKIRNAPSEFLKNFEEISYELSSLSALLTSIVCLQNSEIPAVYGH